MSGEGWQVCRVCGHPNKPASALRYNVCTRCYHDLASRQLNSSFAMGQFGLLGVLHFFCAALGMIAGLLVAMGLMAMLGIKPGSGAAKGISFVAVPAGVALGLWVAHRLRRRRARADRPASSIEMPPGASPGKRVDDQVGHVLAGGLFMFLGFGFSLETVLEGAREEVTGLLVGALLIVGMLGGWLYSLYSRIPR